MVMFAPNQYREIRKKLRQVQQIIDECCVVWMDLPDGQKEHVCYDVFKAQQERDEIMKVRGELDLYIAELEDDSAVSDYYESEAEKMDDFLSRTGENKKN